MPLSRKDLCVPDRSLALPMRDTPSPGPEVGPGARRQHSIRPGREVVMKRIALAMFLMASTSFAASEAPVNEYLIDPSVRSPFQANRTVIGDSFLEQFLARMSAMLTLQTSIAPFKGGTNPQKAQFASHAGVLSASSS